IVGGTDSFLGQYPTQVFL
nr:follipsin, serine proteinase, FOL32K=plasma kallikrein and factor XIa light chain homolog {N-terminal} [swine, ovaries, follicular fluid, Peptide Partial, 18 aa] [Sus scrofa]